MRKIIPIIFLFIIVIFPKSEVSAADCKTISISRCEEADAKLSGSLCNSPRGGKPKPAIRVETLGCSDSSLTPSHTDPKDLSICTCTGSLGPTTTVTGPTTSAKAIPCGTITGSLDYSGGIMTAIGCVPTEPKALVEGLLKYGTFAAGGIAFLMMILAALQMITAEGNPESIKGAQEKFYSAIIGLLLIIFAVLLMQVIGLDILGLPGFGGSVTAPSTRDPNS